MSDTQEKEQEKSSWFADLNWKTAAMIAAISVLTGAGGGAGIVATKGVAAQTNGVTQDQADIRYLTKDEASRLRGERDKQIEELKKIVLSKEVFEAYHSNDTQRVERIEKMLQQILENQNHKFTP